MRTAVGASLVLLVFLGAAPLAHADLTAFLGSNITPSNRPVRGVAVGLSLVIVGFEFEYSDTAEDEMAGAPRLRSGMFNMHLQTPFGVAGLQFYATAGGGLYHEEGTSLLGDGLSEDGDGLLDKSVAVLEKNLGLNVGGGVKITVAGPIRIRMDYRRFTLRGTPLHPTYQRFYAGLNIGF